MFEIKRFYRAVVCAVLCPFFFSCATSAPKADKNEPKWLTDPYLVYNRAATLAAVGYGPGRDGAEKNALAALAAIFGQSVSSESLSTYSYTQALQKSGMGWSENSDIAHAVKTSVEMDTVIGAEIKEVWDSGKGTVYAVAAMDKAKTGLIYSEMIFRNEQTIAGLTALSAGDRQSFEAYARYQQAALLADANDVFSNVMNVISSGMAGGVDSLTGRDYRNIAAEIAKSIPITVTVENDRNDRVKNAFSRALASAGFRTGGSGSRYALRAKFSLEQVDYANNPYRWVRYAVDASLADTTSGTVLFPYSASGREGHASLSEAENRALRVLENSITDSYVKELGDFLSK
jgi:hypothetical protein